MKAFATGLSPEKTIVANRPEVVARIKAAGLVITPYTFRSTAVATGFADVGAEMSHFLTDGRRRRRDHRQPGSHAAAAVE